MNDRPQSACLPARRFHSPGPWVGALLVALFFCPAQAEEIQPGDARDKVLWELGKPQGEFRKDSVEYLLYERGDIRLEDGTVTSSDLISEGELKKRKAAEQAARKKRLRELELERQARIREGEKALKSKLKDEAFLELPAAEQVAYWDSFTETYPEVDLPEEADTARAEMEKKEAEEQARLEEERKKNEELEAPQPLLSSSKKRKQRRKIDPNKPIETPDYLPPYRRLGGTPREYP